MEDKRKFYNKDVIIKLTFLNPYEKVIYKKDIA